VPAPTFQVNGWISGLKIYSRALAADEVKAAAQSPPPKP
jgi:hypothetical protein